MTLRAREGHELSQEEILEAELEIHNTLEASMASRETNGKHLAAGMPLHPSQGKADEEKRASAQEPKASEHCETIVAEGNGGHPWEYGVHGAWQGELQLAFEKPVAEMIGKPNKPRSSKPAKDNGQPGGDEQQNGMLVSFPPFHEEFPVKFPPVPPPILYASEILDSVPASKENLPSRLAVCVDPMKQSI